MKPRSSETEFQQEDNTTKGPSPEDTGERRTRHPMEVLAGALGLVMNKHLLSARETAARLGVSVAQLHRMNSSGALGPRPIKFGEKCSRWRAAEVEAWVCAGCPPREQWLDMQKNKS